MSRLKTALVVLAAVICVLAHRAEASAAAVPTDGRVLTAPAAERPAAREAQSFRVAADEKSVKRQKCEALNECRRVFTICFDEIQRNPKKSWETHENDCAIPYADCIDKNFKTGEMFFTRMFYPFVLKCEKY